MSGPTISVIVPVWNDQDRIGTCIEALIGQTIEQDRYEIIVVDNGSSDGTRAVVARYPQVTLVEESRPGSYAARNAGLARARGEYVAFTDADCVPVPDWLASGLAAVSGSDGIGVAAGRVAFLEPQGRFSRACLNYERQLSMRQDISVGKGYVVTANWFSRKSVLERFGGFDAELKSGGDYQLSHAIFRSGLAVVYVPEALVRHPPRARLGELIGKIRRVVAGRFKSDGRRFRLARRLRTETRNLVVRTRIVASARGLSFLERCEVLGLIGTIWLVSILEILRLQLGGAPARA